MRRIFQLCTLGALAGAVSACAPDQVVKTPDTPTAGVRFINAVPDSGGAFGFDFRFVDITESNAHFRIAFRNNPATSGSGASAIIASNQIEYKNTQAGQRHFRIFMSDSLTTVASVVVKDTTVNIEAGKLYTAILWGNMRAGSTPAMKLTWIEENVPDPGANVALRVINATGSPIDARQYVNGGTAPANPTWANVPALGISSYVTVPPNQIRYNVQPAGGGTALFADQLALTGTAATVDIDAIPGTTVAGSALTMIVFPRSVAGTRTPQTAAFQAPLGSFMWDRRPPRTCALC